MTGSRESDAGLHQQMAILVARGRSVGSRPVDRSWSIGEVLMRFVEDFKLVPRELVDAELWIVGVQGERLFSDLVSADLELKYLEHMRRAG